VNSTESLGTIFNERCGIYSFLAVRILSTIALSVARLVVVVVCIVAKRCVLEQVTIDSQAIGSRIWEIYWCQNERPWPLFRGRIKVMSTIALHSTLNISETVRDRGLVPKEWTSNRKWHMGYVSNGHVTDARW